MYRFSIRVLLKCTLCGAGVDNAAMHKHMWDKHSEYIVNIFHHVYETIVKPVPIRGRAVPIEPGSTMFEPDEEMFASFQEATQLGLNEIDKRVRDLYTE